MPPLQRSNRGGRARTRRDVAVPDAARRLWARNNTPRSHDWATRRLMGFLFCRGLNLQPHLRVFREPSNAYRFRLKRTATYTSAWRVAHSCGRACMAPVGSIVICDCSAPLFFFLWSRPPARHRAKHGAVTSPHRLHVATRRRESLEGGLHMLFG